MIERWLKNARPWPLPVNGRAYSLPIISAIVLAAMFMLAVWFQHAVVPLSLMTVQVAQPSSPSTGAIDPAVALEPDVVEQSKPFQSANQTIAFATSPITSSAAVTPVLPIQASAGNVLPILMYHYIRVNPDPSDTIGIGLSVPPTEFQRQMRFLADAGYRSVTLDDLEGSARQGLPMPSRAVVLTFDDGYADFYQEAYPVLRQYGLKATVFVITDFVGRLGYLTWNQIGEMADSGLITFGAHTLTHPDLTLISLNTAEKQIRDSKSALEAHLGTRVTAFAYPSGQYTTAVMRLVEEAGFTSAVSTRYGNAHSVDDLYRLKRIRIDGRDSLSAFASKMQTVEPPGGFVSVTSATPRPVATATATPTAIVTATARGGAGAISSPTLSGAATATTSAMVAVPNLVGLAEADARSRLGAVGLSTGYVNYQRVDSVDQKSRDYFLSFPLGSVVSQQPAPGAMLKRGTAVTFAVRK